LKRRTFGNGWDGRILEIVIKIEVLQGKGGATEKLFIDRAWFDTPKKLGNGKSLVSQAYEVGGKAEGASLKEVKLI